ncbi:hypothetical protein Poli38472_011550 [Pythium oligandrum]|uniref:Uncharacterized protein n=1 Tax=Pythium oligandrum TaxID=41045 RepID=A0A8K1CL52_PYTOL|nr:hypothetical protein Poli38472_011550 [Pythium oligandrum]|eukprot:TMW64670.1 hypothetical protein Poli38472_011550 [Pythium oligandrum]
MGTVRYTSTSRPPVGPHASGGASGNAKKKKAKARPVVASEDDLSAALVLAEDMLDRKLASRDKWQICTQRNLSEIRSECMNVRRELQKLAEANDSVVMQVEDGLSAYEVRREELKTFMAEVARRTKLLKSGVKQHAKETDASLKAMAEKVAEKVEENQNKSIDEDDLMTQLTGMQEKFDNDLAKIRQEYDEVVDKRLVSKLSDVTKQLTCLHERLRHIEQEGHKQQTQQPIDARTQAIIAQSREDVNSLLHRVSELERHGGRRHDDSDGRYDRLQDQINGLLERFDGLVDEQKHQGHRVYELYRNGIAAPPPPLLIPPPTPPPVDLRPLEEGLHFARQDVAHMAKDLDRFAQRFDCELRQLKEEFGSRQQQLYESVMDALHRERRNHEFEEQKLKSTIFDLQAEFRALRDDFRATMSHRAPEPAYMPRSRPLSPPLPPLPAAKRQRRHYEPLPNERVDGRWMEQEMMRPFSNENDLWDQRRRHPGRSRSRSRSQSRSPPRSSNSMLYTPLNRPSPAHPNRQRHYDDVRRPPQQATSGSHPSRQQAPPVSSDSSEEHTDQSQPQRRQRRPPKPHEVILIDEDEEEEGEELEQENRQTTAPSQEPEPNAPTGGMAPPDRVLDDEDEEAPPQSAEEQRVVSATEGEKTSLRMATVDDLRVGAVLYLCFGGAPSLSSHWTSTFASLRQADCVDVPAVMAFQQRYTALQSFPIHLTQFVIQTVRVLGSTSPSEEPVEALESLASGDIERQFTQALVNMRRAWVERVCEFFSGILRILINDEPEMIGSLQSLVVTVHPILSWTNPIPQDKVSDIVTTWLKKQARAFWLITRYQRFRDTMKASVESLEGGLDASPGVFLLLYMFSVVETQRTCPQSARLRLNDDGKRLLQKLWSHMLSMLPYLFFVDCSWLEDQADGKGPMPVLGLCHILSTILMWNAPLDAGLDGVNNDLEESTRILMDKMRVDGKSIAELQHSSASSPSSSTLVVLESVSIELVEIDTKWANLVELDGFFDVAEFILPLEAS